MADIVAKLSDLKNLQDMSKILVLPMLSVAYISSSNFELSLDNDRITMETLDFFIPIVGILIIFIGKTLFFSIIAIIIDNCLSIIEIYTKGIITLILIVSLLSLGFAGIFANEQIVGLHNINKIWFYSSFVVSFYLHSKLENYK